MKVCISCGIEKCLTAFWNNLKSGDGKHAKCVDCTREYQRQHYKRSSQRRSYVRDTNNRNIVRNATYIADYLSTHPCVDCGEGDPIVLEFDHVRGVKRNSISNMSRHGLSIDTIRGEIALCEVRCANCHRRKTSLGYKHSRIRTL